ncbi:MAG: hypothetical protein NZM25_03950 [Leptospiraceae bacterium]|nr:hypothetical protein [Leptospiraceae bacterium]MDW8306139.1 hypothetical protein [Leptospiraceae bacterium]
MNRLNERFIEDAIRNLPTVELPDELRQRILRLMLRPRYSLSHLFAGLLLLVAGELIWAKNSRQIGDGVLVYLIFGILALLWGTQLVYWFISQRQLSQRNFGKKINEILDDLKAL